jgi:hypothetical protein
MERSLEVTHELLQAFALAPGGGEMIRNHSRVAKIQE